MVKKDLAPKSKTEILLDLMKKREKLAPVLSHRKLNRKYEKLMVEKFLPKDRPLTELDEKINSRRLKKALDAEYVEFNKKTHDKAKEALKKIVTKSAEDIFAEKIKAEELVLKQTKPEYQALLDYFESKESPEQLLNRVAEYVDAPGAVKKEIRELVKLGGYRDLAKQKSIVKKFISGTPAQRALMITDVEATPKAVELKKAIKEELAFAKLEKERIEAEEKAVKLKLKQDEKALELKMQEEAIVEKQAKGIKLKKNEKLINDARIARETELARLAELKAKFIVAKKVNEDAEVLKVAKLIAEETRKKGLAKNLAERMVVAQEARAAKVAKVEADRVAKVEAKAKFIVARKVNEGLMTKEVPRLAKVEADRVEEADRLAEIERKAGKKAKNKAAKAAAQLAEAAPVVAAPVVKKPRGRPKGSGFEKLTTAKGGDIPELTALIGKKDQYNMGKASLKSNEILNDIDDARVKSKKIIIPTEDLMNVQRYENAKRIYKNV